MPQVDVVWEGLFLGGSGMLSLWVLAATLRSKQAPISTVWSRFQRARTQLSGSLGAAWLLLCALALLARLASGSVVVLILFFAGFWIASQAVPLVVLRLRFGPGCLSWTRESHPLGGSAAP